MGGRGVASPARARRSSLGSMGALVPCSLGGVDPAQDREAATFGPPPWPLPCSRQARRREGDAEKPCMKLRPSPPEPRLRLRGRRFRLKLAASPSGKAQRSAWEPPRSFVHSPPKLRLKLKRGGSGSRSPLKTSPQALKPERASNAEPQGAAPLHGQAEASRCPQEFSTKERILKKVEEDSRMVEKREFFFVHKLCPELSTNESILGGARENLVHSIHSWK